MKNGYPISDYEALKTAVNEYGECHVPYEELDYEVELRRGQVKWHDESEAVTVHVHGDPVQTFYFDRMVAPYCPQEYKHE